MTKDKKEIARLKRWFAVAPTVVTTGEMDIATLSHKALAGETYDGNITQEDMGRNNEPQSNQATS